MLSFRTLRLVRGYGLAVTVCVPFNPGRLYGADDFLPVLTYVLAQCDMLELDTEIEYMMELLDPSLLHGEGNYLFIWFLHNIFKYNISVSLNKSIHGLCHCLCTFPQTHCPMSLALWFSNTDVDLTDTLSAGQI